jgi:hypothetical protein
MAAHEEKTVTQQVPRKDARSKGQLCGQVSIKLQSFHPPLNCANESSVPEADTSFNRRNGYDWDYDYDLFVVVIIMP